MVSIHRLKWFSKEAEKTLTTLFLFLFLSFFYLLISFSASTLLSVPSTLSRILSSASSSLLMSASLVFNSLISPPPFPLLPVSLMCCQAGGSRKVLMAQRIQHTTPACRWAQSCTESTEESIRLHTHTRHAQKTAATVRVQGCVCVCVPKALMQQLAQSKAGDSEHTTVYSTASMNQTPWVVF